MLLYTVIDVDCCFNCIAKSENMSDDITSLLQNLLASKT